MQGFHAYRKSAATGWTRIEMLLAIYDATVSSMDAAIEALHRHDQPQFTRQQLRTSKLILELLNGIDADSSPTAARIRDLCVFCIEQITSSSVQNWANAREILCTLREGFRGIREEAIQLEASGVIPRLSMSADTVSHV